MDWTANTNALMGRVEQAYDCDECGADFNAVDKLLRHEQRTHGHGPVGNNLCTVCDRMFTSERGLKIHADKVHKVHDDWVIDFLNLSSDAQTELIKLVVPEYGTGPLDVKALMPVLMNIMGDRTDEQMAVGIKSELSRLTGKLYRYMIREEP